MQYQLSNGYNSSSLYSTSTAFAKSLLWTIKSGSCSFTSPSNKKSNERRALFVATIILQLTANNLFLRGMVVLAPKYIHPFLIFGFLLLGSRNFKLCFSTLVFEFSVLGMVELNLKSIYPISFLGFLLLTLYEV